MEGNLVYSGMFAKVYDSLMAGGVSYPDYADYVERIFKASELSPRLILDLGCGTGSLSIEMAKRGYEMIGVDNSVHMLSEARAKALDLGLDIMFLHQDMAEFELFGTVDSIISATDSLNYILSQETLGKVFKLANIYLNPGGIFMFDLNSGYKLKTVLGDNVFYEISEDVSYVWQNSYDDETGLCRFDLTFFVKNPDDAYDRFDEIHTQRSISSRNIFSLSKGYGFESCAEYEHMSFNKPKVNTERIFYVNKKSKGSQSLNMSEQSKKSKYTGLQEQSGMRGQGELREQSELRGQGGLHVQSGLQEQSELHGQGRLHEQDELRGQGGQAVDFTQNSDDVFKELYSFGIASTSGVSIYDNKQKEKKTIMDQSINAETMIKRSLYEKTFICPVCRKESKLPTVKSSSLRIISRDSDFMVNYKDPSPLLYFISFCRFCGFAAQQGKSSLTENQKKAVRDRISRCWKFDKAYPMIYTPDIAIEIHKLALFNAVVIGAKESARAIISLHIGWLYRMKGDEENEKIFLSTALEGLSFAYENETAAIAGLDKNSLQYLIGDLHRRTGKLEDALKWYRTVMIDRNAKFAIKEMAREQRDLVTEQLNKTEQEQPAIEMVKRG
ncbi:MAG: DUF2225 domain-containing protein [Oscillospiraceae bacterium]|nr:DUF2225 domain-containing protein [Oscillospiraceae bacterium]